MMARERTYIMIKPDGVQRGLVGDIVGRFEKRGYQVTRPHHNTHPHRPTHPCTPGDRVHCAQLKALKLYRASESLLRTHYSDLVERPFFPKLLEYMLSGPVTCMVVREHA